MDDKNWKAALNPGARWMVLFDLESTCSDDPGGLVIGKGEGEAIELGAVVIDLKGKTRPQGFRTLVRPVGNPTLTGRCMKLTGITQDQADAAPSFAEACAALAEFLAPLNNLEGGWAWASWGQSDLDVMDATAARHGIGHPLPADRHHNLKTVFFDMRADAETLGQAPAMGRLSIKPHGKHHRALSDACNLARLYRAMRRYDRALAAATQSLGDLDQARCWMRAGNRTLGGQRPAAMLRNDNELIEVIAAVLAQVIEPEPAMEYAR